MHELFLEIKRKLKLGRVAAMNPQENYAIHAKGQKMIKLEKVWTKPN